MSHSDPGRGNPSPTPPAEGSEPGHAAASDGGLSPLPPETEILLRVNGAERRVRVRPWTTLLDALRERLALTGTKKGCDHGQCGACTVLLDGKRVVSCLTLAIMKDGAEVRTVEGLASPDGTLHPLQRAFLARDAFQCGFCTPGQLCSAAGLLAEGRARSVEEIREHMSGNLCRCGAYGNIVAAIRDVQRDDETARRALARDEAARRALEDEGVLEESEPAPSREAPRRAHPGREGRPAQGNGEGERRGKP